MTERLFSDLSSSNEIDVPLEKNDTTDARELYIRFGEINDYNQDLKRQALVILNTALNTHKETGKPVGITYSANAGQTKAIHKAWHQHESGAACVNGANQAQVIAVVHLIMNQEGRFQPLTKGGFKIIPISTMDGFDTKTSDKELRRCLEIAKNFASQGTLFVWTNQSKSPQHPYAIGGGIARVPPERHHFIMATLANLLGAKKPAPVNSD